MKNNTPKKSIIIIYTGNGKGKTSASVGQAMRAHGQGMRVCFAQFMKKDSLIGEQNICARLFKSNYKATGSNFFTTEEARKEQRRLAKKLLQWIEGRLLFSDFLVLDEALYVLEFELITKEELQNILSLCREKAIHLVLSGRGLPKWLEKEADIVTEMKNIKHDFQDGRNAQAGIEF